MSLIYEALKELEEPTEGVTGAESGVQKHSEPRSGSSAVSARAAPVLTRVYLIAGVTLGVVGAGWTALQMTATPDSIGSARTAEAAGQSVDAAAAPPTRGADVSMHAEAGSADTTALQGAVASRDETALPASAPIGNALTDVIDDAAATADLADVETAPAVARAATLPEAPLGGLPNPEIAAASAVVDAVSAAASSTVALAAPSLARTRDSASSPAAPAAVSPAPPADPKPQMTASSVEPAPPMQPDSVGATEVDTRLARPEARRAPFQPRSASNVAVAPAAPQPVVASAPQPGDRVTVAERPIRGPVASAVARLPSASPKSGVAVDPARAQARVSARPSRVGDTPVEPREEVKVGVLSSVPVSQPAAVRVAVIDGASANRVRRQVVNLLGQGELDQAEQRLDALDRAMGRPGRISRRLRGYIASQRGHLEQAEEIYTSLLADDPDDVETRYNAALVALERGDHERVERLVRVLVEHDAYRDRARALMGRVERGGE